MKNLILQESLKFLSSSLSPSPFTKFIAKQGVSEANFIKQLKLYFKEHALILTNHTLLFDTYITDKPYLPDIVLHIKDIKLTIDIEIDEPYTVESKEPIHYIGSKDSERNEFFTTFGWVVVRFTEEQIIKKPIHCCHKLTEIINLYKPIYDLSKIENELEYISAWTREEALQMANNNFRGAYLAI